MINEVSYGEQRDQRRSRYEDKCEKSNYHGGYRRNESWNTNNEQAKPNSGENSEKSFFPQANNFDRHVTWIDGTNAGEKGEKLNNLQNGQNTGTNASILNVHTLK